MLLRVLTLSLWPLVAACRAYEYIVVGSGPGGGPLAADLARAGHSVLLLEAGDDLGADPVYSTLQPVAASNDDRTRWDFFVKHSDDAALEARYRHATWRTSNGSLYVGLEPPTGSSRLGIWYPRANALGGCATHNAAAFELASDGDWDHVARLTGDESWSAPEMRAIFAEIEDNHYLPAGAAGHGFDGWFGSVRTETAWPDNSSSSVADDMLFLRATAETMGLGGARSDAELRALLATDLNSAEPDRDTEPGLYAHVMHLTADGHRSSPWNYVRDTLDDPAGFPLTLELNAFVDKVLFDNAAEDDEDDEDDRPAATGVRYRLGRSLYRADPRSSSISSRNATTKTAYATREVIVAGGVFNTPQLLKLSGIGPAEELARFDIPVLVDLLGVGRNLHDNYEIAVVSLADRPFLTSDAVYGMRIKSSVSGRERDLGIWRASGLAFEGLWPGWPNDYGPNTVSFGIVAIDYRNSKGTVSLASADPLDPPDINFRFFADGGDDDIQALVDAVNFVHQVTAKVPGSSGLQPIRELTPCPGHHHSPDEDGGGAGNASCADDAIRDFIRAQAFSHHATGTAAIGNDSDPGAVLDSHFRVRGVRRLRVVDASAFPLQPGAYPVLPTAMLSRKASKDILAGLAGDQ